MKRTPSHELDVSGFDTDTHQITHSITQQIATPQMIHLTRLRHGDSFFLNPDYIERVDSHVDTVVRLVTGVEYVVQEPAEEIARQIIAYRSAILAAIPAATPFVANLPYEAIAATSNTVGTIILENEAS